MILEKLVLAPIPYDNDIILDESSLTLLIHCLRISLRILNWSNSASISKAVQPI